MTGGTISIGGTGLQTGNFDLAPGTGAQAITLGNGGTGVKTISIGTAAVANVVTIGSTNGAASTTINSGTGRVVLAGSAQLDFNGTAPAAPADTGGAGPATIIANSTDSVGQIAVPSEAGNTALVLTFNATYSVAPICVIAGADAGAAAVIGSAAGAIVTSTATTMTITYAGIASAKTFNYHCFKTT
jgi:hypothetical protein